MKITPLKTRSADFSVKERDIANFDENVALFPISHIRDNKCEEKGNFFDEGCREN